MRLISTWSPCPIEVCLPESDEEKKGGQLTVDGEVNPAFVVVPSNVREGQRSESEEGGGRLKGGKHKVSPPSFSGQSQTICHCEPSFLQTSQ